MSRWSLLLVLCAACSYGDNLQAPVPDATPPDSPTTPDAPLCAANEASCDGECIDVESNEANCGDCGNFCHGGEVCMNETCSCPPNIIPGVLFPTGFEQFFPVGLFTLALGPSLTINGINGVLFGFDANVPLDTDIDLAAVPLGSTPFVGALVGLDIMNFAIDTSYLATAGTIRFTKRCDTEIEGTLTNATFNGIGGDLIGGGIPTLDPEGCVVQVNSLTFHLATAPCAAK